MLASKKQIHGCHRSPTARDRDWIEVHLFCLKCKGISEKIGQATKFSFAYIFICCAWKSAKLYEVFYLVTLSDRALQCVFLCVQMMVSDAFSNISIPLCARSIPTIFFWCLCLNRKDLNDDIMKIEKFSRTWMSRYSKRVIWNRWFESIRIHTTHTRT